MNTKYSIIAPAIFVILLLTQAAGCKSEESAMGSDFLPGYKDTPITELYKTAWAKHDSLVMDQRYTEALVEVRMILATAYHQKNDAQWTRAIIEASNSMQNQGSIEEGVLFIKNAKWPEDTMWHIPLEIAYTTALNVYTNRYGYEIDRREQIDSSDEQELKHWTRNRINEEVAAAYLRLWDKRESWGHQSLGELGSFFSESTYPARIRGTVRDVYSYIFANEISGRIGSRVVGFESLYKLGLPNMIEGTRGGHEYTNPANPDLHPLQMMAAVLDDLEQWHWEAKEPEAAIAAHFEKLATLNRYVSAADKILIRKHMEKIQADFDMSYPWWSHGQAFLAELYQNENNPDSKILSYNAARKGYERHPDSSGGNNCKVLMERIAIKQLDLMSMAVDAADRKSLKISHRNLNRVYFRAWRLDFDTHLAERKNLDVVKECKPFKEWVAKEEATKEWSVEVPNSGDYRTHDTFTTLPLAKKGVYLVACSMRKDFSEYSNSIKMVNVLVSDLILIRGEAGNRREITARSGKDGRALPGVKIEVYQYERSGNNKLVHTEKTDNLGQALLPSDDYMRGNYFIVARQGDNLAISQDRIAFTTNRYLPTKEKGVLYTDRSIYRPGQTVYWKAVGYRTGEDYRKNATTPEKRFEIVLKDANYKDVVRDTMFTNAMGTASGEFQIPEGRTLGSWTVETTLWGHISIRVEEYKRPTFEVLFPEQKEALRLNKPVNLTGTAQYYFGLPVTDGTVKWHIKRSRNFWNYRYGSNNRRERVVAAGEGILDAKGEFQVTFVPEADDRLADNVGVRYSYTLTADVTDAGGEVHSVEKTFVVGFVSVDARISADWEMLLEGKAGSLEITRLNLDGDPRPGQGTWTLASLNQPDTVLLPADVSRISLNQDQIDPYRTVGDETTARWLTTLQNKKIISSWKQGAVLKTGELAHGEDGKAGLEIPELRSGAYRLVYETNDEAGRLVKVTHDFLVAGQQRTPLALALILQAEKSVVKVGDTARFLVKSALPDQQLVLEIFQDRRRTQRILYTSGKDSELLEIPVTEDLRGGFTVQLSALRDHQQMLANRSVFVPYDNKELTVEFTTFRDLLRPGQKESFTVTIKGADGKSVEKETTELLAYMYDRSLDIFSPHSPYNFMNLLRSRSGSVMLVSNLKPSGAIYRSGEPKRINENWVVFEGHKLLTTVGYAGNMFDVEASLYMVESKSASVYRLSDNVVPAPMADSFSAPSPHVVENSAKGNSQLESPPASDSASNMRENFSETAFFSPHVKVDDDGVATIKFEVPDSVTDWNVWVHAITSDLRSGFAMKTVSSVKELMVRTYLPRFLREGDKANLKVVVNNAGESTLSGTLSLEIVDALTGEDRAADFGLSSSELDDQPFTVEPDGGVDLTFTMKAPIDLASVVVRAKAQADGFADGEQRPLPILPSRLHLMQSRFVALTDKAIEELHFEDMARNDDPTMVSDQMVVTVDGQLFYGVLSVLPYLVEYPYESTEQILNRYLSTGIVTSVFDKYPAVADMARKLGERETQFGSFDDQDPNRKLRLEETPWLNIAAGGKEIGNDSSLINVLNPENAAKVKAKSLEKLAEMQGPNGGFSWRAGGKSSPYMTLYVLSGLARGMEFGVEAPRNVVHKAWSYMHNYFELDLVDKMISKDCCLQTVTFLNYVLSCYPDESYYKRTFTADQRELMLEKSFKDWRKLSSRLKGYLALTLNREGRHDDAELVFGAVMDGAIEDDQLGTYWAPEDQAWLWYNDTIESHATTLRVLTDLDPQDERRHGMVHWLLMNKKLNHWQSTRSTAEVVYALVHYLEKEQMLGLREEIVVQAGPVKEVFVFEPGEYTGKKNQIVIAGKDLDPETSSTITVSKETKGLAFASATWHYSTEVLPDEARGDLFQVDRRMFKRALVGKEWVLTPLDEGAEVVVGDQVEVQLTIRAKHAAEYVHLRDPRGAGFEPESVRSGYRWDGGLGYYSETRDSGANFFFGWLPAGEYTLKYWVRATMSGEFRVGPAVLQSVYAPEFVGYSVGDEVGVYE